VRTSDPTRRYIPEDRTLHNHRCENLRSYTTLNTILWCDRNSTYAVPQVSALPFCLRPILLLILNNYRRPQYSRLSIFGVYRMSQEERSIFWEVIVSVILSKKVYMYMCPIPNGFRDRATSLHRSKIAVSNTGIYCSSDKFDIVYLVQYIFENPTGNVNALCNSCEDMACFSPVQWNSSLSQTVRNRTHVHIHFFT
jgi:hypothetical protein